MATTYTPEVPWYTDANVALADVTTVQKLSQSQALAHVQVLLGTLAGTHGWTGAAPVGANWTVVKSCDSTAVATGTSNWLTIANLVRAAAGTAHSWIVLTNGTFHLCLDYSTAADYQMNLAWSKSGFTTGGTTRTPHRHG
jgi:hypothetical protein